jgi:hypothetical protein
MAASFQVNALTTDRLERIDGRPPKNRVCAMPLTVLRGRWSYDPRLNRPVPDKLPINANKAHHFGLRGKSFAARPQWF